MKTQSLVGVGAGLALVAALAGPQVASAQARAAAAPPAGSAAALAGPNIPGVCILSRERVIGGSKVGQAVSARMQTLAQQVRTELAPDQTSLQSEAQQINAQKATLAQAALEQKIAAFQQHEQNAQRTAAIRNRELEVTQDKALQRINTELQPVVVSVYTQRNCGILLDQNAVLAGGGQMDITDQVVTGLNGRIQSFAFERERINLGAAQGATTPAAPPKRK